MDKRKFKRLAKKSLRMGFGEEKEDMPKNTYREEFNRLTHDCSAIFCFGLLAHAMGLSEYHAYEVIKNAKEKDYKKAIKLYKSMIGEEQ